MAASSPQRPALGPQESPPEVVGPAVSEVIDILTATAVLEVIFGTRFLWAAVCSNHFLGPKGSNKPTVIFHRY